MEKVVDSREKTIIRTSIIGIAANVLLAAFKAVIGILSNSIAIVMDAVNNISDAGSSLITIIGTKLAGREPDKKHPFGSYRSPGYLLRGQPRPAHKKHSGRGL